MQSHDSDQRNAENLKGGKLNESGAVIHQDNGDRKERNEWKGITVMATVMCYIFKPNIALFWLTQRLVNTPTSRPLRVYLCLACPYLHCIGLPCTTTLVTNISLIHPHAQRSMPDLSPYRTTLHQYIMILTSVVT